MGTFRSFVSCLSEATREWHEERRNVRLFDIFLKSPVRRQEMLRQREATPTAMLFMLLLLEFVRSPEEKVEIRSTHELSCAPLTAQYRFPSSVANRWTSLIWAMRRRANGSDLVFVADDGASIPIYVATGISSPAIEKAIQLIPENIDAVIRDIDEFTDKFIDEQQFVMALSKSPLRYPYLG